MIRQRAILLVILFAFFLRVWDLPQLPPGLWYDEAYNAMDALWMAETGHYPLFFVGNNGREPMWHYLLLLSTSLLGNTTFAVRWVGALAGFLTVPIIYRFALSMLRPFSRSKDHRYWLALLAAGWLAVSWWHLLNSRAGFRPVLLPPLLMLSLYFWMAGIRGASSKVASSKVAGNRGAGEQESRGAGRAGSVTHHAATGTQAPRATFHVSPSLNFILAGLFLGLCQYTYLPARLAPLIFVGLTILWTFLAFTTGKKIHPSSPILHPSVVRPLWLGLLITGLVAGLVFAPLGLFFLNNPEVFFSRTGDVAVSADGPTKVAGHLLQAVSLFLGAGHELYRHHLPGRAMLGWLEIPFFWLGLIFLLRPTRLRHPESQLLLLGLGVMWLPALLASPPVHGLRPIGILPFYYLIVTLGLDWVSRGRVAGSKVAGSRVAGSRVAGSKVASSRGAGVKHYVSRFTFHVSRTTLHALRLLPPLIIALNGLINTYDYFYRWADQPETYQEYNGPLVDLTQQLIDLTRTRDVIIPFHLYVHPTTRYLLWQTFPEMAGPPPASGPPVEMLLVPSTFQLLYVGNIPESPALVLLTRDDSGQGAAYVSRLPRAAEQVAINELLASRPTQPRPFRDRLDRTVAQFVTLQPLSNSPDKPTPSPIPHPPSPISNLFDPTPLRTINLNWADLARLEGYEVTPELAQPGQPMTLNFYWQSLTDKTFEHRLFLQLLDGTGNPVNQWEGDAFREDMYRWRPGGILPTQHTLWLGPDTPPGPYLVRMGFFDQSSGQRLPLRVSESANQQTDEETPLLDQIQLGLFYVTPDGTDPRRPASPLSVNFAGSIELIGTTLPQIHNSQFTIHNSQLTVTFHWEALQPTAKPYTVFLQLLYEQGQVVSSWDSQPFTGLYPTNLWSPGERIADTFLLPLSEGGLPPGNYRLITGFYDFDTDQRLPVVGAGDFAEMAEFVVGNRE